MEDYLKYQQATWYNGGKLFLYSVCWTLMWTWHSWRLTSAYILSLPTFVSNNREQYFANSEIHNINTRHTSNLHLPGAHLNIYQQGVYYSGIKIFNSLPRDIKTYIDNPRAFKKAVKNLYTQTPSTH